MKVHQNHVGAGDDALRGGMHKVRDAVRSDVSGTDRVRGVNADGQMSKMTHHRHMPKVHEVTVGVAHVGFHAPETENDVAVAFAREVFGGI